MEIICVSSSRLIALALVRIFPGIAVRNVVKTEFRNRACVSKIIFASFPSQNNQLLHLCIQLS